MDFKPVSISDKKEYEKLLMQGHKRGCEFTFANLFMWGRQNIAFAHGHAALFSLFGSKYFYPFPVGEGDTKALVDSIIEDAEQKGIDLCFTGIYEQEKAFLERAYPDVFSFYSSRGSYDYVYDIDDLADLAGKKYHRKRNHLNQFQKACPDYRAEPITKELLPKVAQMAENWYAKRLQDDPDGDYDSEKEAINKALSHYDELGMDGMVLVCGEEVIAFTMGSMLSNDTMDVHFEKARGDINGAYTAINYEFARYIRVKYPMIKYLDREEDMGLEGLRKAKESYYPHHLVEKYRAVKIK